MPRKNITHAIAVPACHRSKSHTKQISFSISCTLHTSDIRWPSFRNSLQAGKKSRSEQITWLTWGHLVFVYAIQELRQPISLNEILQTGSIHKQDFAWYKRHEGGPSFRTYAALVLGTEVRSFVAFDRALEPHCWLARTRCACFPLCNFSCYLCCLSSLCQRNAILDPLLAP